MEPTIEKRLLKIWPGEQRRTLRHQEDREEEASVEEAMSGDVLSDDARDDLIDI